MNFGASNTIRLSPGWRGPEGSACRVWFTESQCQLDSTDHSAQPVSSLGCPVRDGDLELIATTGCATVMKGWGLT